MTADVFFMDLQTSSRENLPDKLSRFIMEAGLAQVLKKKDLTALKLHFGEKGNTAFIRPVLVRKIIRTLKNMSVTPFLTDTNTLYLGSRTTAVSHIQTAVENGFSFSSMDAAPIIIADGLRGRDEIGVKIDQKNFKTVYIGSGIFHADALIGVAHFKGHDLSGFGGALKNLGMGCASRRGKMAQHSDVKPKIKRKTCIGCGDCARHCPPGAIFYEEKKAYIDKDKCIGCAECMVRCPTESISVKWKQDVPLFLEKMIEYAKGAIENKKGKCFFINFITDISPKCDCVSYNEAPIVGNIGVVASTDPVAVDQASADLVNSRRALSGSILGCNLNPGEDKFKGLYPDIDWEYQLDYAQSMKMGERKYRLKKIETLVYR